MRIATTAAIFVTSFVYAAPAPQSASAQMERANLEWASLDAQMGSLTQDALFMLQDPQVRFWSVLTFQQVRTRGLDFFRQYPRDTRRWAWVQRMQELQMMWDGLGFVDLDKLWAARTQPNAPVPMDEAGRRKWAEDWEKLRTGIIAGAEAPVELRCKLRREKVDEAIRPYMLGVKPPADYDWMAAGEEAVAIARLCPAIDDPGLLNLVSFVLRATQRYAPDAREGLRQAFLKSPNADVRTLAAADTELAALREQPLDMKFTALDGREIDLAQLRGRKIVLLDFWASTWCGACHVQKPLMKDVYAKYHDQGLEIIGVACELKESDRDFLAAYVRENGIEWPQYFDSRGMNNDYTRRFGFRGIPQYLLLDRSGKLVASTQSSGGLRNLEEVVRQLLGLEPLKPGDELKRLGASS